MGIPSRERLENQELTSPYNFQQEQRLFEQSMRDMPGLSEQQKNEFSQGGSLEGTVFADLQDENRQQVIEETLGTDLLRTFEKTKHLSMIRNDAVHVMKTRGVTVDPSLQKDTLDVTHPNAFDDRIQPHTERETGVSAEQQREDYIKERLKDREAVLSVNSDERLYSFSDEGSKTLYFGGEQDALNFDSPHVFTYDGQEMGSGTQALQYAKTRFFNDPSRALAVSREPMNRDDLARKDLLHDPYEEYPNREEWKEREDEAIQSIVQAKMDSHPELKEALKQTAGYRLAYADKDDDLGIGLSIRGVNNAGRDAAWKNKTLHINESNPDTNNRMGRAVEAVRTRELHKEQEVNKEQEVEGPEEEGVYQDNPFETGSIEQPTDARSIDLSNPEPDTVEIPVDIPAEPPKKRPLEVSFHAGQNLTPKGEQRASEAALRVVQEAERHGRDPVIHVAKDAPNGLKKAVYQHKDQLTMKEMDTEYMPDRSLLVQQDRKLTPRFKKELVAMTRDSERRDVRALDVDPSEPDAYGVNDYLLHTSQKTKVSKEQDYVSKEMDKPSIESRDRETLKSVIRTNDQRVREATQQSGQTAVKERHGPDNGVYQSNPF